MGVIHLATQRKSWCRCQETVCTQLQGVRGVREGRGAFFGGGGGGGGGGVKCGKRQESIRKKDRADRGAGQKIKGSEFDCWFSGN